MVVLGDEGCLGEKLEANSGPRPGSYLVAEETLNGIRAIRNHIRFILVLAKLKQLDPFRDHELKRKSRRRLPDDNKKTRLRAGTELPVQDAVDELDLAGLFDASPGTPKQSTPPSRTPRKADESEDLTGIPVKDGEWDQWFALHRQRLPDPFSANGSPFNGVYECRSFYGLDAPNNLADRFRSVSKRIPEKCAQKWTCDTRIGQWGHYAVALVDANGGWEQFASKKTLDDVLDFWPGGPTREVKPTQGGDIHAFIQRVLYLERDRYIQLLVSPVALLWPLWIIKRQEHWGWMENVKTVPEVKHDVTALLHGLTWQAANDNSSTRPTVYFDVNTHRNQMRGLPYPFAFASDAVNSSSSEEGTSSSDDEPWTPSLLVPVGNKIIEEKWSPPLLFALRGDQWERRTEPLQRAPRRRHANTTTAIPVGPNYPVPIMTIAEPCDRFATVYARKKAGKGTKAPSSDNLRVCFEEESWAERALKRTSFANDSKYTLVHLRRDEMTQRFDRNPVPDFVLSHYPADLLLRTNPKFRRMDLSDPTSCGLKVTDAKALGYVLPSCVLIGGITLSSQPKMLALIRDLGRLLWTIEGIFRRLTPISAQPDLLDSLLWKLHSGTMKAKQKTAEEIARVCVASSRVPQSQSQTGFSIEQLLKDVSGQMADALEVDRNDEGSEYRLHFQSWGWALLLEYVPFTTVSFSAEFLIGVD